MLKPPFVGINIPKLVYSTESKYNGHIDVIKVGDTYKIKVDKIEQSISPDSPNAPRLVWGKVVEVIRANEDDLKNILILGLGGGTAQHLISRQWPNAHIVSIDIDPVMYDIAKEYFDIDSIQNHRVIIDDACGVIIDPQEFDLMPNSFQVLFVDIYIGSQYPDLGKSGNFVNAVKNMLVPDGLVIFNRIYTHNHQDEVNQFIDYIEQFFHDVQTYVVAGYTNSDNVLIYGRA